MSERDIEQRMDQFRAVCREAGIKQTPQRMEIYREIACTTGHPDAETIFAAVRSRMPSVSLDTVYRTLWLLTNLGLLTTLGAPRERVRFDANTTPHHHFVCTRCGKALDFYDPTFDSLPVPKSVREMGNVLTTHVELRGLCADCSAEAHNQ